MRQIFSIWLLPAKEDSNFLGEIIKNLSRKYSAPTFIPHLTIYGGGLKLDLERAKKIVTKSVEGIKPFIIEINKINRSDNFWKTVFIEIKMNKYLEMIYQNLKRELIIYNDYELEPHLSLIYKKLPLVEKNKIIKSSKIKSSFLIDKIAINYYLENKHYEVENWKLIYIKSLDKP